MYLSIITLNVNGLNAPTKRHSIPKWIRKQDPYVRYLQEMYLRLKNTQRTKVMGWEKLFHENQKEKKVR